MSAPTRISRRGVAALGLSILAPAAAMAAGPRNEVSPDAVLIDACRRLAEQEIENRYRYAAAPDEIAEALDTPPDWATYNQILETKATTVEGWRAKALAYVAWDGDCLSDANPDADACTRFLSSLMRDIVTEERDAIVARMAQKYGPLPPAYSPNGIWLGWRDEA